MVYRFAMLSINLYSAWIHITYSQSAGASVLFPKKPSFRCVGWDSATFPVLRQRWVFPCIFYMVFICCLSGFLGELALPLKCRWLVWIMTFQLYYALGGKKQGGCRQIPFIWLFKRCRCCDGQRLAGMVRQVSFQKWFFVSEYILWSKLGWVLFFSETWPYCRLRWKLNPNDSADAAADFNMGILHLAGHSEVPWDW